MFVKCNIFVPKNKQRMAGGRNMEAQLRVLLGIVLCFFFVKGNTCENGLCVFRLLINNISITNVCL